MTFRLLAAAIVFVALVAVWLIDVRLARRATNKRARKRHRNWTRYATSVTFFFSIYLGAALFAPPWAALVVCGGYIIWCIGELFGYRRGLDDGVAIVTDVNAEIAEELAQQLAVESSAAMRRLGFEPVPVGREPDPPV